MIGFKEPYTNNLKESLRLSNKMLKAWYLLNLPQFAIPCLKRANAAHQEEYQQIVEVKPTEEIIESYSKNKLFSDFVIYLYPLEKDDTDIQISMDTISKEQANAIKTILAAIKNVAQMSTVDIFALLYLEMNIATIASKAFDERQEKINFLQLAPWFKIGTHILDMANQLSTKRKKSGDEVFFIDLVTKNHCVLVNSVRNYFNLAKTMLNNAGSELDYLFAEDCIQKAEEIFKDCPTYLKGYLTTKNRLYAMKAQIDLKNNDHVGFVTKLNAIVPEPNESLTLIEPMHEAAKYYESKDVEISLHYYGEALKLKKEICSTYPKSLYFPIEYRFKQIEEGAKNLRSPALFELKLALQKLFSTLKIKIQEDSLLIFLPLEEIPLTTEKLFNKFATDILKLEKIHPANANVGTPKYVGIQFSTSTFNTQNIIKSIESFLEALEAELSKSSKKKKRISPIIDESNKLTKANPENIFKEATSENIPKVVRQDVLLIEEPETKYVRTQEKNKKKTHKVTQGISSLSITESIAEATPICHAADYGFKDPCNPEVTPVYCSEAAQEKLRAKLFVSFKGIEGVEKSVEDQFKELLNPRPKGILTVGKINQAGVKLWKHPDVLGDSWNLCALRFKRKGASGWLRVVAEPQEKVIIKRNDGKEESRYLFSLGKPVHK